MWTSFLLVDEIWESEIGFGRGRIGEADEMEGQKWDLGRGMGRYKNSREIIWISDNLEFRSNKREKRIFRSYGSLTFSAGQCITNIHTVCCSNVNSKYIIPVQTVPTQLKAYDRKFF